MKQNTIIDTEDGKVKIQFEKCFNCKNFDFCYKDLDNRFHKGVSKGLDGDCIKEN